MTVKYTEGYPTTIVFANTTTAGIEIEERAITPPPLVGGGAIEKTTMKNTAWRTRLPKTLKDLGPMSLSVSYNATAYTDIIAQLNANQSIVITFPDSKTLTFWGFIESFTPGEMEEGERALADMQIIPTNLDASDVETAPVIA